MTFNSALSAHLATGATTTCHCWAITRKDGTTLGFTDHDGPLAFDGIAFRADSGLSASALQQGTGLSVDNSDAIGALSDSAISEADVEAGRYDEAEVTAWMVNWSAPNERQVVFRGTIGEITRSGGAFRAELRGLAEILNRPQGRIYQKTCSAVLGNAACGLDLDQAAFRAETTATDIAESRVLTFATLSGYDDGWFTRGRLEVLDGPAVGLSAPIKRDWAEGALRCLELWSPLRADPGLGAMFRLDAGCDKRFQSCREKFGNGLNFQGFPDIPGEDWLMVPPSRSGSASGGSRR
ncbi:DUF2163 domain-containing protein [Pseudooceanicola algae]|uniref:Bacteriophage phiJL001 Gp84 C-terminal domain-containing protein n=1 Tax=Pseudooceanicola algae TaxID=1537215 RepID=A0A418SBZ7_9RHOB|nr:DUF2163 domain-containing protein [Pseudooceanicola algae]QPM89919.1 hypothetical protein PSAL_011480 [Pseudooceanicola algae]